MSEEAIDKRNEMFRGVHPAGPATHEKTFVTVDESVYNGAFTATQGKTLADVQRENEQTVNDLFKPQEKIGKVLEKRAESNKNFLKTWGISKDDFYDQTMKYLKDHREEFKQIQEAREFVEKHEKYEREQESARTFKETWGMSKEEMYEKNLAEVRASDKTEQALNKMATILDKTEIDQEEIGSVFEKPQYPDLKDGLTEVKGIDQKVLDNLRDQVDKLDNNKKEAELKNRDEATMSGPKGHSSTLDMLK